MNISEVKIKSEFVTVLINSSYIDFDKNCIPDIATIKSHVIDILATEKINQDQLRYFVYQVYIKMGEDLLESQILASKLFKGPEIQWPDQFSNENPEFKKRHELINLFNESLNLFIESLQIESDEILNKLGITWH